MNYTQAVLKLKADYTEFFTKQGSKPYWAYHKKNSPEQLISPTIPFVGKNYFEQPTKVLVYASAENLSYYGNCSDNGTRELLENDSIAINRHRYLFDNSYRNDEQSTVFYPDVHIAPIDDGRLSVAIYYLLRTRYNFSQCIPKEFYEKICFANYGKFSAESNTNKDYASDKSKLSASKEYISSDLNILNPDVVIMVKSMLNDGKQRQVLQSFGLTFDILPIYQITPTTINRYIKEYAQENYDQLDDSMKLWFDNIKADGRVTGKTKENYKSLFSYLDSIHAEHI